MKMKTCLFVLLAWLSHASFAADITISGPTSVCPGVEYSYTASARNIFGPQDGCFQWTFYLNGVVVGYDGGATCPCYRQSDTYTVAFTWPSTGIAQISIQFNAKQDPTCNYSYGVLNNINVRTVVPERVGDAAGGYGGLSFCPGQTRTIYVPDVPYGSPEYCIWHHAYDWIVPSGWTISSPGVSIPGGIRTHATSINVTAPSNLSPGYSGNYFITVRTEPAWPWPKEINRQVWVGVPNPPTELVKTNGAVYPGSMLEFAAYDYDNPDLGSRTYNWDIGGGYFVSVNGPYASAIMTSSYISVSVSISNSCGTSQAVGGSWFYDGNGGGDGCPPGQICQDAIYPNPASDQVIIEFTSGDQDLNKFLKGNKRVTLINQNQEKIISKETDQSSIVFPVNELTKGIYLLEVQNDQTIFRRRIVIDH
jgi:hypothetical protein